MMNIKKVISIIMVFCVVFSSISIAVFSLSWDGSSAGGSTNAVNGSATGYVIRDTEDANCVVGYRFSSVTSSGAMKVTKVIDVYRNTATEITHTQIRLNSLLNITRNSLLPIRIRK